MNTTSGPFPQRQRGKHIAITGAGTGIGRAIALRLAEEGAQLSLFARNSQRLEETAREARERCGASVFVIACDIRERSQVDSAFQSAKAALGPICSLVANSGVGGANAPGPDDRFDDLILTNLTGTYSCMRAAERHLLSDGSATRHLLAISSILARIGVPGYTGYCASKAGLSGLVRALATELASEKIQVNAVCPGWVDTEMAWEGIDGMASGMKVTREEAHKIAMQAVPLGRMSRPEDIAGLVAWLLSEDARGVTGQCLDMNGGAFMV